MEIKLTKEASRRAKYRVKRHGYEYDLILQHFINDKPAPFGLLFKSRKTDKYVWFDNKQITMPDYPYGKWDCNAVPDMIEGIKTYTPDHNMLCEYLDHVMANVFSKRDQKKYAGLYEKVKENQPSLFDRLNA